MKAYIGSSRINGNPLANFEETSPRIPLQKFEPVSKVADGEVVSAQAFGEFAPREGRRHGRSRQCAGRIWGHRCRIAVVAQVVDENASTANTLRNGGDIAVGPVSRHRLRDRGGERFRPNRPAARPEPRRGAPLLPDVLTKLFRLQVLKCSSLAASMTASQGASSPGSRSNISRSGSLQLVGPTAPGVWPSLRPARWPAFAPPLTVHVSVTRSCPGSGKFRLSIKAPAPWKRSSQPPRGPRPDRTPCRKRHDGLERVRDVSC
jgi:hypothetical protein